MKEKDSVAVLDEAISAVLALRDPLLEPAVAQLRRLRHLHNARHVLSPGTIFDLEVNGVYTGTLEALCEFDLGEIVDPLDPPPGSKLMLPDELILRGLVRSVSQGAHGSLRMVTQITTHGTSHSEVAR